MDDGQRWSQIGVCAPMEDHTKNGACAPIARGKIDVMRRSNTEIVQLPFQVVQSLRMQSSNRNYSELGSCPALGGRGDDSSSSSAVDSASLVPPVSVVTPSSRPLLARRLPDAATAADAHEETLTTPTGARVLVARQGDPARPAMVTYHDLGLNYLVNFHVSLYLPT